MKTKKKTHQTRNMKAFSNLTSIAYPLFYRNHQMPLKKTNCYTWTPTTWKLWAAISEATQSWES